MFAVDDPDAGAPALVYLGHCPLDLRGNVAKQRVCRGMGAEGGGNEVKMRRRVGEFAAGEVAVAEEASVALVPANARPSS